MGPLRGCLSYCYQHSVLNLFVIIIGINDSTEESDSSLLSSSQCAWTGGLGFFFFFFFFLHENCCSVQLFFFLIHKNSSMGASIQPWVDLLKRLKPMQAIPSSLMEPILVKDTSTEDQITAACCASTCVQEKQTPVCYLCCAANRMMFVVGVIAL